MKILQLFFLTVATLLIAACAFDKKSSPEDRKTAEDYLYLQNKYSQVTGVYSGYLVTSEGTTQQMRLTLITVDVPNGTNTRGESKLKPELRARFSFESTAKADVLLDKVDYLDSMTPPQLLITSTPAGGVNPEAVSAQLDVFGQMLQGDVKIAGRRLGTVRLTLQTRDTSGPGADDRTEENLRLIRIFKQIEGLYAGEVTVPSKFGRPFTVTVNLTVESKTDASGKKQTPTLAGVFHRDLVDYTTQVVLVVDYTPELNPPTITMIGVSSTTCSGGFERVNISATIQNGVIQGEFQGFDRNRYPIRLEKKP